MMCSDLYKKCNSVVSLVMQNQAEKAIDLLESGNVDTKILNDIGCCGSSLPLYKLSLCNAILLDDDNWSEGFLPVVERNRQGCKTLLDYWDKRWNYTVHISMDFFDYQSECAHFKDWDLDELLDGNLDELVALGYNKDEVELCYAVLTYKPDLIQKHIALRTNPNVYISGDIPSGTGYASDGESHNALDFCHTVYCDALDCYGLAAFGENKQMKQAIVRDVHLLLEAAAYRDLEKKLEAISVNNSQ